MDRFFTDISKKTTKPPTSAEPENTEAEPKKAIPRGVVLGKDGKPCRSCTSFASWAAMTKKDPSISSPSSTSTITTTSLPSQPPSDCPPDVNRLGNHTWTFLHTLTATYPTSAPASLQHDTKNFLQLFSRLYPCWSCAEDFQRWMQREGNEPRVGGRGEFGRWMCEAHNEVNRKLGKGEFECAGWEERWRTGPGDGRCG